MSAYRELSGSRLDSLAELYSIIVSVDHIESAHLRDSIVATEYTDVMTRLLSQYSKLLQEPAVERDFDNIDKFAQAYGLSHSRGIQRIKLGIPATAEAIDIPRAKSAQLTPSTTGTKTKDVAVVTGLFITFCDGLRLKLRTKFELHPILSELITSLNKVTRENFEGRAKIVEWLITLNQLKQGQQLSEEQAAQCLFDIETAYRAFMELLE